MRHRAAAARSSCRVYPSYLIFLPLLVQHNHYYAMWRKGGLRDTENEKGAGALALLSVFGAPARRREVGSSGSAHAAQEPRL